MTAVETTRGIARRSSAYWQAIAETAIMIATPAINPSGAADGFAMTLKMRTAASSRNCTRRSGDTKPKRRRCEACAISQTPASASMKTGMASPCAKWNGPPCTASAAATTRLPVTWAVKTWPRVKKPVRSTIPAMTLSRGGKRHSRRDSSAVSSAGRARLRRTAELLANVGMFSRSYGFRLRCSVLEVIDDGLRNDEAEAHRQDNGRRDRAVRNRPADQLQGRLRAAGDLHEAARHPEQVDPRYHRDDGGEADGGKRHVSTARDRCEDQPDDDTGDESTGRDA